MYGVFGAMENTGLKGVNRLAESPSYTTFNPETMASDLFFRNYGLTDEMKTVNDACADAVGDYRHGNEEHRYDRCLHGRIRMYRRDTLQFAVLVDCPMKFSDDDDGFPSFLAEGREPDYLWHTRLRVPSECSRRHRASSKIARGTQQAPVQ